MNKYNITVLLMFISVGLHAQAEEVEMADALMENGRIYVVVGVLLIILIGLFIYLISIDRKIGKLEKQAKSK